MTVVMIGVDPHKASHTAVAIGAAEEPLGQLRVRACAVRAERLVGWARAWPRRAWAVEGAGGTGHLLAQQLLAAGERVLDVPPKLAPRVRLLATGNTGKNDPNDARSVAVAALRSAGVREARRDDHAVVLKVWSKRYQDLGRARTQVACRLHQVLCELLPGGVPGEITAGQAEHILASMTPAGAVDAARWELAAELTGDLRGVDAQIRETRKKAATAVRAAGTSLTRLFGVGPVIAAAVIGDVRHVSRFPNRDTSPLTPAPPRSRSPRAAGKSTGCPGAATAASTTPSTWPRSPRSATSTARAAPPTTRNGPKARPERGPALKRQISDAIYACLRADARRAAAARSPGGQPGHRSESRAAGSHPARRLFGQATPGPATHPTTPAGTDAPAAFPAPPPSRASEQPRPGPGKARPRSGANRRP
jgi:transposase